MLISQKDSSLEKTIVKSYPLIIRYCLSITRNHWDAEDLAHDTIEKILNKYQHLEVSNVSKSLLYKIASNQWIDNMRKKNRSSENVLLESNFTDRLHLDQTLENLDSLMERLTPKQAIVLVLKDVFLYKLGEIANSLKTNEVAIKSLLNRARKNLKSKDENEQDNSEYWKEVDVKDFHSLLLTAVKFEEVAAVEALVDMIAVELAPSEENIQQPLQVPQKQPANMFKETVINRVSVYKNIA